MPSLAADAATIPTASAATALAASFSPDANVGTAAGATATAASTTCIGMAVGTDPIPAMAAPPTAEHMSSFLSNIRRHAAGDDTATAASTAETMVTPPSPDVSVGVNEGATANPAFDTTVSSVSSDINDPTRTDDATMPAGATATDSGVDVDTDVDVDVEVPTAVDVEVNMSVDVEAGVDVEVPIDVEVKVNSRADVEAGVNVEVPTTAND